jgi:hypothetical protein
MNDCELKDVHLERLMWNIRPLFSNLYTLDVAGNNIESLRPIEHKINQIQRDSISLSQPGEFFNNSLRELRLYSNPTEKHMMIDGQNNSDVVDGVPNEENFPRRKESNSCSFRQVQIHFKSWIVFTF